MVKVSPVSQVQAAFDQGQGTLVSLRLSADWITPVRAFLSLKHTKHRFLLESVERAVFRGRYSVLGWGSDQVWTYYGQDRGERVQNGLPPTPFTGKGPQQLKALLSQTPILMPPDLPPLAMGFYGFLGFDMIRDVEVLPDARPNPLNLPVAKLFRPAQIMVFDNVRDEIVLVKSVFPDAGLSAASAHQAAVAILKETLMHLSTDRLSDAETETLLAGEEALLPTPPETITSSMTKDAFCQSVLAAKEAIAAGDCFQIVLSQRFSRPFDGDPFSYYRRLRRLNPSPYLFFLDMDDLVLVGSSPETLVKVEEGQMTVRPIAGTRPRGQTQKEDQALAAGLLADPKEIAEHLMLLDLGRNDVSRVCVPGSVQVKDPLSIERYSHVMHIVSTVEGTLRPEVDVVDAFLAGFPAGTVSGAPKVRAMETIDGLEPDRRGPYGGGVGYFSADGQTMDTCIALRTAIIHQGKLHVQAGAGIVADSDPDSEYTETVNKAKALLVAV
jgi:anthranilate synthase component 1